MAGPKTFKNRRALVYALKSKKREPKTVSQEEDDEEEKLKVQGLTVTKSQYN